MTIEIEYNATRTVKTTFDTDNPRIYSVEYMCAECGEWVDSDETVWIDPATTEATTSDRGQPYHVECAPETGE